MAVDDYTYLQESVGPFTKGSFDQPFEFRTLGTDSDQGAFDFLTGAGGFLQTFPYGLAGLRWSANDLYLNPNPGHGDRRPAEPDHPAPGPDPDDGPGAVQAGHLQLHLARLGRAGHCLDDSGFGGSGTVLEIWDCNGGANQEWTLP